MQNREKHDILLTWELGNELGHLARLRPLALKLQQRGHRVMVATSRTDSSSVLPASVPMIEAPSPRLASVGDAIREPATFADILYNTGATQTGALEKTVRAWRTIFDETQPDVVVQDYSPFALLALQGLPPRSVLLGTGFACPPDTRPLPDIRAWQNHYPDRLAMTERAVLDALNAQLERQQQPQLEGIGELFTKVDANCLATFPELDHYPARPPASQQEYVGVWSDLDGSKPNWPDGEGPRIFAYLKPFRALPRLLEHISASGHPCLVFTKAAADLDRWQTDHMRIVGKPLDMRQVTRECDFAILHAGHGSTATVLLAGKPILQLPFNVEQFHTAKNTEGLGAGVMALTDDTLAMCAAFDQLIANQGLREGAARFAAGHSDFDADLALEMVVLRIEQCVGTAA
ncbi:MAG: hypothetical protein HKN58_00045 [Xanthomonadales bacterium]|nr:hypothetical protein [Xanthomonadales bacterium]